MSHSRVSLSPVEMAALRQLGVGQLSADLPVEKFLQAVVDGARAGVPAGLQIARAVRDLIQEHRGAIRKVLNGGANSNGKPDGMSFEDPFTRSVLTVNAPRELARPDLANVSIRFVVPRSLGSRVTPDEQEALEKLRFQITDTEGFSALGRCGVKGTHNGEFAEMEFWFVFPKDSRVLTANNRARFDLNLRDV